MELTKTERLILANQYAILERVDSASADHYRSLQAALNYGYALEVQQLVEGLDDAMGIEECRLVWDVLDMYAAMRYTLQRGEGEGLSEDDVAFQGFDGNNETAYMAYARYIVHDLERFEEFRNLSFNSHSPSLDRYRRMVSVWKSYGPKRYEMTADQVRELLETRSTPA